MTASFLSPVVKRLLAEHGLDPAVITGTGADGRVTKADVLRHVAHRSPTPAARPPDPARTATDPPVRVSTSADPEQIEAIPFTPIRRVIAEHMVRSLATSAHTLVVVEVDYDTVDRVRRPAKEQFRQSEGFGLTYLPFIVLAASAALGEFPQINATVGTNARGDLELRVHRTVSVGVAVDLDFRGLIVPVIRDVSALTLTELAREITTAARRAQNKELTNDDLVGGTFTITNAGGFGTLITGPIINQPQVAILSTDGVKIRPVAVPNPSTGAHDLAFHPIGNLALTFDHRAFDGAYASAFLARTRDILETLDWQQELER